MDATLSSGCGSGYNVIGGGSGERSGFNHLSVEVEMDEVDAMEEVMNVSILNWKWRCGRQWMQGWSRCGVDAPV